MAHASGKGKYPATPGHPAKNMGKMPPKKPMMPGKEMAQAMKGMGRKGKGMGAQKMMGKKGK